MIYKTSELTGGLLDVAVAKALGWQRYPDTMFPGWMKGGILMPADEWEPSSNWYDGGPIIELERISVNFTDMEGMLFGHVSAGPRWYAGCAGMTTGSMMGPTALVAAMRAFVQAKIGNTVDL